MTRKALVLALSLVLITQPLFAQETQEKPQEPQGEPYTMQVEVPMTVVDLVFTNKRGNVLSIDFKGDAKNALEVYEDGKPQTIAKFETSEAPLTTVLLVEASPLFGYIRYQNLEAAYLFLQELRRNDWVALVSYDIKPTIEVDFTHDKDEIYQKLTALQIGGFSEANMYDALIFTLDKLKESEEKVKTSIIVVGTGYNTAPSKYGFDDVRRAVREHRTTIFFIDMTWLLELYYDRLEFRGYNIASARLDIFMARAQMQDLAKATGGAMWSPRFETQLPDIYKTIGGYLRAQHTIGYYPTNKELDGKKRKIEVKFKKEFEEYIKGHCAPGGGPCDLNGDEKIDAKDLKEKITIHHRTEYYPGKVE